MTNRLLSALQQQRLARGLRWKTARPPFPWRFLQAVVVAAGVAGVLSHIDELEARTAKMEHHWTDQFAQCLSGQWRGITDGGTQIACLPAETFNPKRGS
jgi:hypothetical protein